MSETKIDIVFSFDTTGSMYPCVGEVKRNITSIVSRLFTEIPHIRIGIIAHGDYCDGDNLMSSIDLTDVKENVIKFINEVKNTSGGDFPEAYEYVLNKVQDFAWNAENRSLVMIGDAPPHEPNANPGKLDWRVEAKTLFTDYGVNIYSVQCLDRNHAPSTTFYKQLAKITDGYHLKLDQFSYIRDMMLAICFKHAGDEKLSNYEQELKLTKGGLNSNMKKVFDAMLKRTPEEIEEVKEPEAKTITACPPAKFQILTVDSDCSIKEFVMSRGLIFKAGKGFYEFTKPELISMRKELVLLNTVDLKIYEGDGARQLAKLVDYSVNKKIKPSEITGYTVFIQSTSYNRKLIKDTKFLYEVDDWIVT